MLKKNFPVWDTSRKPSRSVCVHARVHAHVGTHTHTCLHISIAGFQNTFVRTNSVKWELRSNLVPSESGSMSQGSGTGAPGVCTGLVQLNGFMIALLS